MDKLSEDGLFLLLRHEGRLKPESLHPGSGKISGRYGLTGFTLLNTT